MLLKDSEIRFLAETTNMISPFVPAKVRTGLSYGLSSTGYDIRLSAEEAYEIYGTWKKDDHLDNYVSLIDPKKAEETLKKEPLELCLDPDGSQYFHLCSQGVMLGVAVEQLNMPSNVMALCMTKSSYARVGVFANITPVEAGWRGYLTLEIKNFNDEAVKIYANEGIAQLIFFQTQGNPDKDYGNGKYQNQEASVVMSRT